MNQFSNKLLHWHQSIERKLPWKSEKNVFHIWLSEIILQQTRVEQGIPYFLKFKDRFANVLELANASDEELMKMWQGLGYYSRARNLHKAAKQIAKSGGEFPRDYQGLLNLPGVGPYTAAAIASFAYDLPHPVIDGNVNRVIARIFGVHEGIDTKEGKSIIEKAISQVFENERAADFNQAIMDFGALMCTPKKPQCNKCPFQDQCFAFSNDAISGLPFKAKKIKKKERILKYLLITHENKILIKKRTESDIWQHLHDFPEAKDLDSTITLQGPNLLRKDGPYKHILTHRTLYVHFDVIEADYLKLGNGSPYFLVERENLRKFAFPKIIDWYLDAKSIYLDNIN